MAKSPMYDKLGVQIFGTFEESEADKFVPLECGTKNEIGQGHFVHLNNVQFFPLLLVGKLCGVWGYLRTFSNFPDLNRVTIIPCN
jgi:hypothetical protein